MCETYRWLLCGCKMPPVRELPTISALAHENLQYFIPEAALCFLDKHSDKIHSNF